MNFYDDGFGKMKRERTDLNEVNDETRSEEENTQWDNHSCW